MVDYDILCEQLESLAESDRWFLPVLRYLHCLPVRLRFTRKKIRRCRKFRRKRHLQKQVMQVRKVRSLSRRQQRKRTRLRRLHQQRSQWRKLHLSPRK